MFVDPKKPKPLETGEKKDYIGKVMEAIVEVNNANINNGGDPEVMKKIIADAKAKGLKEIDDFTKETTKIIKDHTDKKGAVHGETKKSVGLYYKENWPFATQQEHKDGIATDKYVNPKGLHELVKGRVGVDENAYIKANIIPITSSGLLGDVCQWPYDWATGVHVESARKTKDFNTNSPWTFSTPTGTMHFPAMTGDRVLTNTNPAPGRPPIAVTAWGGTQIRVYDKSIDLRRSRPQLLRGWSADEPRGRLLVASAHLFDRNSVFFCEDSWVGVRSFNKNVLPFDILSNNGLSKTNWDGIIETRENVGYNIESNVEFTTYSDISTVKTFYLTIKIQPFIFSDKGMEASQGPGRSGEQLAVIDKMLTKLNFTIPADGSIKIIKDPSGNALKLALPLTDYITPPKWEMQKFYDTGIDTVRSELINFAWSNRLAGEFTMRIPFAISNIKRTFYWNRYFDFEFKVTDDPATNSCNISVKHKGMEKKPVQEFDEQFETKTEGYLTKYDFSCANDWAHPRVFDGVFEGTGGHIKTYSYYNRQYVGFFQHDLKDPMDWMYNPTPNGGLGSKYNYTQMSTINSDGFYGDHLRHIPLRVNGKDIVYLTRVRNYQHRYEWCLATIEKESQAIKYSPYNQYVGPWRDGVKWVEFTDWDLPSFVIQNDPDSTTMNITNLVFNEMNNFTGKASYTLDREIDKDPVTFGNDIKLDTSIYTFMATLDNQWKRPVRQFFLMDGCLFFITQTVNPEEKSAAFYEDGRVGVIKGAWIDGDKVKINGDITANAVVKPIVINLRESMAIDQKTITGLDPYDCTDVYAIKTTQTSEKTVYDVMVNLAPFNNFYFEFVYTKLADGSVSFSPSLETRDQVFPYGNTIGFGVNYDATCGFGSNAPHRLHPNFQTPVMLAKAMWAFRKTPSSYGFFTKSDGFVKLPSGVMDNVDGIQVVPLGGYVTVKGKNFMAREPITFRALEGDIGHLHDELFVRPEGTKLIAYSKGRNPMGYETEPHNGAAPLGFIDDGVFYHYDQHGYRNALMPVVDGKRLSIYSYGSTIPAFLGKRGSGEPINRYFLTQETTLLTWNGGKGKAIPIQGKDIKITIEGVNYPYDGSGTFTVPFGGTGDIEISGLTKLTWGKGLVSVMRIGSDVVDMDFSGSEAFNMNADLPRRFTVLSHMFRDSSAAGWPGLQRWDVSNILDFNTMFYNCPNFNQDLSTWRTSSGKHFGHMFAKCPMLAQRFGSWDVQKAKTMNNMFEGTAIDGASELKTWNVSNVQNMSGMFKDTPRFNEDISKWNVSCCMDFSEMFMGTVVFNRALTTWNMRSAKTMMSMFEGALAYNGSLYDIRIPYCTNLSKMFKNAVKFNEGVGKWGFAPGCDLSEMFMGASSFRYPIWFFRLEDVVSVRDMFNGAPGSGSISARNDKNEPTSWVFNKCTDFDGFCSNTGAASNGFDVVMPKVKWTGNRMFANDNMGTFTPRLAALDVSNCTSMKDMFKGATFWKENEVGRSLANWDVSKVTDFSGMFAAPSGDPAHTMTMIENWDMSSAKNISGMLEGLRYANPDLSKWNVSKVTNFSNFASGCDRFNSPIGSWNVSQGINFSGMFKNAKLFNQPIGTWNVGNGTNMASMFEGALVFNQPLNTWNVAKVVAMEGMFNGAAAFNQDLSGWKTTNLKTMQLMFNKAIAFNGNVGTWNLSKVTSLKEVFYGAKAFNQDVSKWDVSIVTEMVRTFADCLVFNQDLSGWKVQRVTSRLMFDDNTPAWTKPKPVFP